MCESPRRALVTGASGGLGEAFCRRLSEGEWQVIATGRDETTLQRLARTYPSISTLACDLSEPSGPEQLIAEVPTVELLIACAGAARAAPLAGRNWEEVLRELQLNALSVGRLCHAFGAAMAERGGGRIITVASTAAARPAPELAAYAASKAFVLALSRALAAEWKGAGVGVCCCVPGPIRTPFRQRAGLGAPAGDAALAVADAALRASDAGRTICHPSFGSRIRWSIFSNAPEALLASAAPRPPHVRPA